MKRLIKIFVIEIFALYLTTQVAQGIEFQNGFQGLIIGAIGLTIANYILKPIINLLLIPINLLSFNLFKWVTNALVLYIVDLIVNQMKIVSFSFPGYVNDYLTLPKISFDSPILVYFSFSLVLSLISSIIHWLTK